MVSSCACDLPETWASTALVARFIAALMLFACLATSECQCQKGRGGMAAAVCRCHSGVEGSGGEEEDEWAQLRVTECNAEAEEGGLSLAGGEYMWFWP